MGRMVERSPESGMYQHRRGAVYKVHGEGWRSTMRNEQERGLPQGTRLLPCYLRASDDGLVHDAVMLCEVIGEEIQSISLRVAADAITRWYEPPPTAEA